MNNILAQIREELKANTDSQTQKSFQRFFKEQVKYYGVKTENVGKIAKKYWKQVQALDKKTICHDSFYYQNILKKDGIFIAEGTFKELSESKDEWVRSFFK